MLGFSALPAVIWRPRSDLAPGELCPLVPPRYAAAPLVYMNWTDSHSQVEEGVTFVSCRINCLLFQTIWYC